MGVPPISSLQCTILPDMLRPLPKGTICDLVARRLKAAAHVGPPVSAGVNRESTQQSSGLPHHYTAANAIQRGRFLGADGRASAREKPGKILGGFFPAASGCGRCKCAYIIGGAYTSIRPGKTAAGVWEKTGRGRQEKQTLAVRWRKYSRGASA